MRHSRLLTPVIGVLLAASWASAQPQPPAVPSLLERASRVVESKPTAAGLVGLSEMYRAAGQMPQALDCLARAAKLADGPVFAARCNELACWRMMPVGRGTVEAYRLQVQELRQASTKSLWLPLFDLYVAGVREDRAAMSAVPSFNPSGAFPSAWAESYHLALLQQMGLPPAKAGLEVIAARNYDALHALSDLDRTLDRESRFLAQAGKEADAKAMAGRQADLRAACKAAARTVVERLFALQLAGDAKQAAEMTEKVNGLGYLKDRQALTNVLARLNGQQAWARLVKPLLDNELEVVASPPDLTAANSEPAQLKIASKSVSHDGGMSHYVGAVQARLDYLMIVCEALAVAADGQSTSAMLTGSGTVTVRGLPGLEEASADRFSFSTDSGAFALAGNVRLKRIDGVTKLRTCTIASDGEIRDARSLLDDLAAARDIKDKLALLPKIAAVYDESELTDEARFLTAMKLLQPHLEWIARYPFVAIAMKESDLVQKELRKIQEPTQWSEAHGGEPWMRPEKPDVGGPTDARKRQKLARIEDGAFDTAMFWRMKDPQHADVAKAVKLLRTVRDGRLNSQAWNWIRAIECNNTKLTFDVPGNFSKGQDAGVVMDVRAAEKVSFRLYKVRDPKQLTAALNGIGEDFIYSAEGLGKQMARLKQMELRKLAEEASWVLRSARRPPQLEPADLVDKWDEAVADLKCLGGRRPDDWDDEDDWEQRQRYQDEDARQFGDDCRGYRHRIRKEYRPEDGKPSSWQCDRWLPLSAKRLATAGAYILEATANGQKAYVPLIVDPLILTMRRCQDGVFVMVTEGSDGAPVEDAAICVSGMADSIAQPLATTDANGAAFVRVLAYGDVGFVAAKDGRFAVGGFGRVFESLFLHPRPIEDRAHKLRDRMEYARMSRGGGNLYSDPWMLAAYTDRPIYRPGQEASFKLIVRQIADSKEKGALNSPQTTQKIESTLFRADEMDYPTRLVVPSLGTEVRYEVINPRGRSVASGSVTTNDFGTASGKIALNAESATGTYSLRINVGGIDHVVPDVFVVQYYRRPNFELTVAGVPEKVKAPAEMTLDLTGRYYFGKAVAGSVDVKLVAARAYHPASTNSAKLDSDGKAQLKLPIPDGLGGGAYTVIAALTDDSGRTVTKAVNLEIEGVLTAKTLAVVPPFALVGTTLRVPCPNLTLTDAYTQGNKAIVETIHAADGFCEVKLDAPGWHTIRSGVETTRVFAYGEGAAALKEDPSAWPRWVNLTDYAGEDGHADYDERDTINDSSRDLLAIFDKQHVRVGDKLRVLVQAAPKTRLLFTIEGNSVSDYFVTTTGKTGNLHVVEIPITKRHLPNFYLQGRILSGPELADVAAEAMKEVADKKAFERDGRHGEDPRWCRVDVIDPDAKPAGQALKVTVEADASEYRPAQEVGVRLKVTDWAGRPVEAEVSLSAIDESLYAFGPDRLDLVPQAFSDPHPPREYYRKTWRVMDGSAGGVLSLKAADAQKAMKEMAKQCEQLMDKAQSMQQVQALAMQVPRELPLAELAKFGAMPVGNVPLAALRTDFRETACWMPHLRTSPDGTARATFKLPDSLTAYRLSALGLTKQTELGVGRASLKVSMPLSAQVFLPRFAVEKDRLLAVALVHNNTSAARTCQVAWEADGIAMDAPEGDGAKWQTKSEGGKTVLTGTLDVAADATATVAAWVKATSLGTAKVAFRVADGKDADAEQRELPVYPLGWARDVTFDGTFTGSKRVTLPEGFVAQDLRVSLSQAEIAKALDGLGALVDYPHGCVEQTMSRFLPAVMVKHAIAQASVSLPPEVQAKLPDVLSEGLERLYNFQHADGGWGWWDKDATNDGMTVYVVYGLARCQAAGTQIDKNVLARGCDYLRKRIAEGQPLGAGMEGPDLIARGCFAMALAGRTDKAGIEPFAKAALEKKDNFEARCNLAMACREVGLHELGRRLWQGAAAWEPAETSQLAIKLSTQVAFGEELGACRLTAAKLLAKRSGLYWDHTRNTSWAIEALSAMLRYDMTRAEGAKRVAVLLAGKAAMDLTDAKDLAQRSHYLHAAGSGLPAGDAMPIEMIVVSKEPASYLVQATGIQRQDTVEAMGKEVRLTRRYTDLGGRDIVGPVKVGQVIVARLTLELDRGMDRLIVEDRRPAGLEFADDRLDGAAASKSVNVEFRDDRVCAFFGYLDAGKHEVVYYLRAETAGTSQVLPGSAYPMYNDRLRGSTASAKLEVVRP